MMGVWSLDILLPPSCMNWAKSDEVGKQHHHLCNRSFLHFPTYFSLSLLAFIDWLSIPSLFHVARRAQKLSGVGVLSRSFR